MNKVYHARISDIALIHKLFKALKGNPFRMYKSEIKRRNGVIGRYLESLKLRGIDIPKICLMIKEEYDFDSSLKVYRKLASFEYTGCYFSKVNPGDIIPSAVNILHYINDKEA